MDGNGTAFDAGAVETRPASTLVLMRDSPGGFEVFVTVRPKHLRFMAGATVFPGGAVDASDLDPRWEAHSTLDPSAAASALGMDDAGAALGVYVCALREAFEEVGFLGATAATASIGEAPESFLDACIAAGVTLATDRLIPAGRWVTPLGAPVRFDARFFLLPAPPGFHPVLDPAEVESCDWVAPGEALAAMAAGRAIMAPPTIEMLQRLDAFSSVAEAAEALGGRGIGGDPEILSLQVSPLVRVVLAPNPGTLTGPGTNTYIVGAGPTAVIDPAVDDERYLDAVIDAAAEVSVILVTHRHPDHVGGARALSERTGAEVRAWGGEPAGESHVDPLGDGEVVSVPGADLRALHTPGHASDHLCFHFEAAASLFAGDNVLGEGTAVIAPPDGDMGDYMDSLERLAELHVDRIYPGHWRPLDGGKEVIRRYIEHRRAREAAILDSLGRDETDLEDIVARAYSDTPVELHPIAAFSATAHLEMLERQGKVRRVDDRWKRLPDS